MSESCFAAPAGRSCMQGTRIMHHAMMSCFAIPACSYHVMSPSVLSGAAAVGRIRGAPPGAQKGGKSATGRDGGVRRPPPSHGTGQSDPAGPAAPLAAAHAGAQAVAGAVARVQPGAAEVRGRGFDTGWGCAGGGLGRARSAGCGGSEGLV